MEIQKARIDDVPQIHKLINHFADKDEMLPRALSELYENLRDVFVVRDEANQASNTTLISAGRKGTTRSKSASKAKRIQRLGALTKDKNIVLARP